MESRTTHYRRLRQSKLLGCYPNELPDNRGKHGNHIRGSRHPKWNHTSLKTIDGYTLIRVGLEHPLADPNGYAPEHIVIWVAAGNSKPLKKELIHHKNKDRQDNRIENLICITKSNHNHIHNASKDRDDRGRFVGKKAAGRLLDGRTWDEYPKEDNHG
jgi:hypothetical protein